MTNQIPAEFIKLTKEFLGEDDVTQFRKWYEEYGTVSPTYKEDNIIYIVNFREGRAVRGFMRRSGFCKGWKDADYDSNWPLIVKAACGIKEKGKEMSETKLKNGKFAYYKDTKGEWGFKLIATNGQIVLVSEGYSSKVNCMSGIDNIKRLALNAEVIPQ